MRARRDILNKITAHMASKDRVVYNVVEEIKRALREMLDAQAKPTNTTIIRRETVDGGGGGANIQNIPYPFVLEPSSHLFPDGINPAFGEACTLVAAEILVDPTYTAPTGDVAFTFQNAAAAPTSQGILTLSSGERRAENTALTVSIEANQRLYVKTPANLNGLQNLYVLRLKFASGSAASGASVTNPPGGGVVTPPGGGGVGGTWTIDL